MKIFGVCLIVLSMVIGFISDNYIDSLFIEPFVAMAFAVFLVGMSVLILSAKFMDKVSFPYHQLLPNPPNKCKVSLHEFVKIKKIK